MFKKCFFLIFISLLSVSCSHSNNKNIELNNRTSVQNKNNHVWIKLKYDLNANGQAENVQVIDRNKMNTEFEEAVINVVKRWKYEEKASMKDIITEIYFEPGAVRTKKK